MPLSQNAVWAAFASTALISLAPNVLLVLFPRYASGEGIGSPALSLGQALAAGGLLGDVFLHAIPHSLGGHHDHHDGHGQHGQQQQHDDEASAGAWILMGFSLFLVADMIVRGLSSEGHGHAHGEGQTKEEAGGPPASSEPYKTSTVLLNLAADALHNFTDGLAIGASFANHVLTAKGGADLSVWALMQSRGGLATLSILCHEVPHELGDFAVLVRQGFSKRQAIAAQFGTAVAAMVGTAVGLGLQDYAGGDRLVLVTAGGFVYLAAVTILPDVLESHGGHHDNGGGGARPTWRFRLGQLLCFFIGIAFMHAVSLLEGMDADGHHHHGHHEHHGHHDVVTAHHDEHHGLHDVVTDHHDEIPHHDYQHHDHHDHGNHDHGEL